MWDATVSSPASRIAVPRAHEAVPPPIVEIRHVSLLVVKPDITAYRTEHLDRFGERFGDVPDLVVEVVSDDPASRTRDYEDKRRDYSAAGIPEYWIIDPAADRVLVLSLESGSYTTAAERRLDDVVQSRLFPGFAVRISSLLAE